MANYLPVANPGAAGADFTLTDGQSTTLSLSADTAVKPGCTARIEIKSGAGTYQPIGLLSTDSPILVLQATGTFRVVKGSNPDFAFGVERD